ncbi:LuxR C-terminal-related transcriptional regulator [Kutzneria viridogrisea]|uniref:DNA-binding CsgD family transcriptional regulator/tetratricopeptide (TPR) repeat protein n=1 Tax=Kutzneria viridogrisea TaxID=47990 RepID=A0ABR6BE16_9PSEU|nr:DNA-binding CsgD family transcriptional regulator/tetratricopeptide (TPR) repeat protein [Kutzneria viridogrisea]
MLLERHEELARARAAVGRALAGGGTSLVVSGPLGAGKSALLREIGLLASEQGAEVLRADASRAETHLGFAVVRQLFEPVLPIADERLDRWANPERGEDPTALHGLTELLRHRAEDRPLVLLLDDVQWSDQPSLCWLDFVQHQLADLPVVLVLTAGAGDPAAATLLVREILGNAAETLTLQPLSQQAVGELVAERFGGTGDERFVPDCHEVSAGNPMVLRFVLDSLHAAGVPPLAEHLGTISDPVLGDWVLTALRAQPAPVRALAEALAVLGGHGEIDLVAPLAGVDEVGCASARRALTELGLLGAGPLLRLVNPAIARAIEESLPAAEHDRLHARAATLLHDSARSAEQIAEHLRVVMSPQQPWAGEVLRVAAESAIRRGEYTAAVDYLRRALLGSSLDGGDRARLLIELASAERALDPSTAVRHVRQALPLLDTVGERIAAVVGIVPTVVSWAPRSAGALVTDLSNQLTRPGDLAGRDRRLALRLAARARYGALEDPAQQTEAVAELLAMGPDVAEAGAAERELASVLLYSGALTVRLSAAQVTELAGRVLWCEPAYPGHAHGPLPLVIRLLVAGDRLADVRSWLDVATEQARRMTSPDDLVLALSQQALAASQSGLLPLARELAAEALALVSGAHHTAFSGFSETLVRAVADAGDSALIERMVRVCQSRPADQFDLLQRTAMQMLAGSAAAAQGDHRCALDQFLDCGRHLDRVNWHNPALFPWRSRAAALHHRLGNQDAAQQLMAEELVHARKWGAPTALARSLRLSGRLVPTEGGVDMLREAVEVVTASDNRLEHAKALTALGMRLRPTEEQEADQRLREARAHAAACGAGWLVELTTAALNTAARRPGAVRPVGLTATERQVTDLVVGGRTNGEIATELGVTRRAVEKHLTKIYRKLAVDGRAGLAAIFAGGAEPLVHGGLTP